MFGVLGMLGVLRGAFRVLGFGCRTRPALDTDIVVAGATLPSFYRDRVARVAQVAAEGPSGVLVHELHRVAFRTSSFLFIHAGYLPSP